MIPAIVGAITIGLSLGIFGSGGSILTVPILLYVLHHPEKVAIAESLGIVGAIALASAVPYARARLIDWRTVLLFGLPGMAGTYGGAWIAGYVSGSLQIWVFTGVMVVAAALMLRKKTAPESQREPATRSVPKIVGDGLLVGILTGFVGVGGGFLIVPALVLLGGLSMRRAVATSLVIIALKSATGFWKYLGVLDELDLAVDWGSLGWFALFGTLGSWLGSHLTARWDPALLRRGFALLLLVMAGVMATGRLSS